MTEELHFHLESAPDGGDGQRESYTHALMQRHTRMHAHTAHTHVHTAHTHVHTRTHGSALQLAVTEQLPARIRPDFYGAAAKQKRCYLFVPTRNTSPEPLRSGSRLELRGNQRDGGVLDPESQIQATGLPCPSPTVRPGEVRKLLGAGKEQKASPEGRRGPRAALGWQKGGGQGSRGSMDLARRVQSSDVGTQGSVFWPVVQCLSVPSTHASSSCRPLLQNEWLPTAHLRLSRPGAVHALFLHLRDPAAHVRGETETKAAHTQSE